MIAEKNNILATILMILLILKVLYPDEPDRQSVWEMSIPFM